MYIHNRPVAAIYRLIIGCLAVFGVWIEFSTFGESAWRLFSTIVMLGAAIYFIISAIVTAFWGRRDSGEVIAPTFQGMFIVGGAILTVGQLVFYTYDLELNGPADWSAFLIDFLMPILMLMDWALFSTKGRWRPVDPFYWLALPACYTGMMIITSVMTTRTMGLRFPYEFLNYPEIGIDTMIWWLVIIAVVILAFGYLCMLLDFAIGGRLAEHIVLPRIKTIVVEEQSEQPEAEVQEPEPEEVIVAEKVAPKKKAPAVDVVKTQAKKKPAKPVSKQPDIAKEEKSEEIETPEPTVTMSINLEEATKITRTPDEKTTKTNPPKDSKSPSIDSGKAKAVKVETTENPAVKPELGGLKDDKSAKSMHGTKSSRKKSRPVHTSK